MTARTAVPAHPDVAQPHDTPRQLSPGAIADLTQALNPLLADTFTLYMKTKNFHWHVSGPHFRDYHLLFDEQATQIFAMTDAIAERVRKIGGTTLRSIGQIARQQRLTDSDTAFVAPDAMLSDLAEDNKALAGYLRDAHKLCEKCGDVPTASLIEIWIDEAERRVWFLREAGYGAR